MRSVLATAAALLLTAGAGHADTIIMDNGDRYAGRVTGMSGGTLQLQGEFGDLRLPWARISELAVERPVELVLSSGTRLTGSLTLRESVVRFEERELAGLSLPQAEVAAVRPADAPRLLVEGRINLGAAATRGNTDTQSYHTDGEFIARTAGNRFRLSGQLNYAAEDGRRTENDAAATLAYDHFVGQRWYFNSTVGLARDEFKNLDLRTTAGIGLGYQLRDLAQDRLAVEAGLSYVHENFVAAESQSQPAARYALNFLRALSLGPTLFHRHELLAGLEDSGDALLHMETGIRFPLLRQINGTFQINLDYDWQPPPGAQRQDLTYLITFGYEFLP